MNQAIKSVSDGTFEREVLSSELPVLVDYWAEWCAPCKMIAPMLDEWANEYAGRLSIAKLNVDENQQVPVRYHIRSIPTLMLFKGGQVVATQTGGRSKAQIAAFLDAHL